MPKNKCVPQDEGFTAAHLVVTFVTQQNLVRACRKITNNHVHLLQGPFTITTAILLLL